MLSGSEKPQRNSDAAFRVVDGEAVVVSPKEGVVRVLNSVGTLVWEMSDGKNSISEIVDSVTRIFEVDRNIAQKDVAGFVHDLTSAGIMHLK